MLIGIDGSPLTDVKTGVGHYTFELAKSLALASPTDQIEIVSPSPIHRDADEETGAALPPNLRLVEVSVRGLERNWWTIGLPRYLRRNSVTLFHGTNYDIPLWKRCPTVLTIHDLSAFLCPDTHPRRHVLRARRRVPLMARIATRIVTDSEATRRELTTRFRVAPEKVTAVPPAPRSLFRPLPAAETLEARGRLGIADDFLLYVGTIEPRKNVMALLRAYRELLKAPGPKPQLVIAGKKGWLSKELFEYVEETGLGKQVCFTGYLSDQDLCALYSSCRVFVYPSIYEGFGLPPLEAMACGAPVIASSIPSMLEVLGDAARLVPPDGADELALNIIALFRDKNERERLAAAGLKRARQFSWRQTAEGMLTVYREALERHGHEKN